VTVTRATGDETGAPALRGAGGVTQRRWWRELLYILGFYGIYTLVRDLQGSAGGTSAVARSTRTALSHAHAVIHLERDLHIFVEQHVQHVFLHARLFLQATDLYYGSAHFVVTAAAFIWLFRRSPERYPLWRNTLAITTALALIGFATFPLMPPRLLDLFGSHYGFVDTLERYGGSWSFDSDTMQHISNQYAAMPSLHFAWALWCTCALLPGVRRPWTKALVIVYPALTVFAIVVTANHFFLDAAGGALVFAIGFVLARPVTRWQEARAANR
jgi:hypothetical protein